MGKSSSETVEAGEGLGLVWWRVRTDSAGLRRVVAGFGGVGSFWEVGLEGGGKGVGLAGLGWVEAHRVETWERQMERRVECSS